MYRFNFPPTQRPPPPSKYLSSADDLNTNDPNTPFILDIFYAARTGDLASVREFITANPRLVKSVDRYGNRALYYACLCGHPAVVRYLLQSGDPIDLKDLEGHRYYLASLTDEIRNVLRVSPTGGFTMNKFVDAAERGNVPMFQSLLKQYKAFMGLKDSEFVDLSDIVDVNGATFVQICQQSGHDSMLSFLMQNGYHGNLCTDMNKAFTSRMFCDTTIIVNGKKTPAHLALLEARAPELYKHLVQSCMIDNNIVLKFDNPNHEKGFDAVLQYLYSGRMKFPSDVQKAINDLSNVLPIFEMEPVSAMSRDISKLRTSSAHYDFKIISEDGVEFPVHKFILASRCEYFNRMLSSSFLESTSDHFKVEDSAETKVLLDYLYTDRIGMDLLSNVQISIDLLALSEEYLLKPLKSICEKSIIRSGIDYISVPEVLTFAHTLNAKALEMYCAKRLIEHFPELRDTEEFEALPSKVKLRAKTLWEKQEQELEKAKKLEEEQALKNFAKKNTIVVEAPKPVVVAPVVKPIPTPTKKANGGRKEMEQLESKYMINKGKKN